LGHFFPWKIFCIGWQHVFQFIIWHQLASKRNTAPANASWDLKCRLRTKMGLFWECEANMSISCHLLR
jgi:hypothetical protein